MQIISAVMGVSLLIFGAVAFVAIARPQYLIGWVAWWAGERSDWRQDRLTEEDQDRYHSLILKSYPALLMALFSWAFVVGAVVSLGRL